MMRIESENRAQEKAWPECPETQKGRIAVWSREARQQGDEQVASKHKIIIQEGLLV